MKIADTSFKFLNLSNKIYQLKEIETMFPKSHLNNLIIDKFNEIMELQNTTTLGNLEYAAKRGKYYHFSKHLLPIVFLRDIHQRKLSLENVDEEQNQLVNDLEDRSKCKIPVEKRSFLKNAALFLTEREEILNNFKRKIFPTKKLVKILNQSI